MRRHLNTAPGRDAAAQGLQRDPVGQTRVEGVHRMGPIHRPGHQGDIGEPQQRGMGEARDRDEPCALLLGCRAGSQRIAVAA